MLGRRLLDPHGVERAGEHAGLGLLPCETHFQTDKTTRRRPLSLHSSILGDRQEQPLSLDGYEIHMGRVRLLEEGRALGTLDGQPEGCISGDEMVLGTLVHGLFDDDRFRKRVLLGLQRLARLSGTIESRSHDPNEGLDRLADSLAEHLDLKHVNRLLGLAPD
jgi:adenosylcobyric acid synthase